MKFKLLFLLFYLVIANIQAQHIKDFFQNSSNNEFVLMAGESDGVNKPTDLDFHPDPSRNDECWILLKGSEDSPDIQDPINLGFIYHPDSTESKIMIFKDTDTDQPLHYGGIEGDIHFLLEPMGIAFGDNGNFATVGGSWQQFFNDSDDGKFQGPVLYSSDESIYVDLNENPIPFSDYPKGRSFHLDMLHENTWCMGIAHEIDNVYWVFDGHNGMIVRYNFNNPHEPGGHDHSDAHVLHYRDVEVSKIPDIASHMILDKSTGWLYISDSGNGRIVRLNINSTGTTMVEELSYDFGEYFHVTGAEWEVVVDEGLITPSGIEIVDNYLLVSDNSTSEIIQYEIEATGLTEIGRIQTGATSIMGIKYSPNNELFFVDYKGNEVVKIKNSTSTNAEEIQVLNVTVSPNPMTDVINVELPLGIVGIKLTVYDLLGRTIIMERDLKSDMSVDVSSLSPGNYQLVFEHPTIGLNSLMVTKI